MIPDFFVNIQDEEADEEGKIYDLSLTHRLAYLFLYDPF